MTFKRCEYLKGNNLPQKMVIKGKYFPFRGSGVQGFKGSKVQRFWIPAFAGMTSLVNLMTS
jgi:hypothetical protein